MKKAAICFAVTAFLSFSWAIVAFSETAQSVEDEFVKQGLLTEQEYIAAKKHRASLHKESPLQDREPGSSCNERKRQENIAREEKAKAAEQKREAKKEAARKKHEERAQKAEQARAQKAEQARMAREEQARKAEQSKLAKAEAQRKQLELKAQKAEQQKQAQEAKAKAAEQKKEKKK